MKVLSGILVLSMLSVILFSSCQKEIDWGFSNKPQSDSTFLERVYTLDSVSQTQVDTIYKVFLSYDNSKRLQKTLGYYVGDIDTFRVDYFYNGSEILPYKIVEHDLTDLGVGLEYYRDTVFYQYTNSGQVSKDSSIEWYVTGNQNFGISVSEFVNTGSKVVRTRRYYSFINGQYTLVGTDSNAFLITLQGNNIINQIDTSTGSQYASIQLSYDGKPNPEYKVIKTHYPILLSDEEAQSNNAVDVVSTSSTPFTNHFMYSYIYRNDNYPLIQWATDQTGFTIKTLYFYKAL
jgi:hypothetical protein